MITIIIFAAPKVVVGLGHVTIDKLGAQLADFPFGSDITARMASRW